MTKARPAGDRAGFPNDEGRKSKLRILYIARWPTKPGLRRKVYAYLHPFQGQDGFFLASLCAKFDVTIKYLDYLLRSDTSLKGRYDWILINYKSSLGGGYIKNNEYEQIKNHPELKYCCVGLVANNDKAGAIPNNERLNQFDIVFKRELLRDLDRYQISEQNKLKLFTTMLPCPLVSPSRYFKGRSKIFHANGTDAIDKDASHDVFFLGSATNPLREQVATTLCARPIDFIGGIYYRNDAVVPNLAISTKKFAVRKYVETIRNSKINLAIEGYGEFTYRHLEIWFLSAFMLCSASIRDIQLPIEAREGEHYVVFESIDDLIDKVNFYLKSPIKRQAIAKAGKEMFSRCYDFHKHGEYIGACLRDHTTTAGIP